MINDNKTTITSLSRIQRLIEREDARTLNKLVSKKNKAKIADMIEDLGTRELGILLRLLENDRSSSLFIGFDEEVQERLINDLTQKQIRDIFGRLQADDVVEVLDNMASKETKKLLLDSLTKNLNKEVRTLTKFKYDEIGRHMSLNFISLRSTMTIRSALSHLRRESKKDNNEFDNIFYVLDKKDKAVGHVSIKQLLAQEPGCKISDLMGEAVTIQQTSDVEDAIELFQELDLHALAIVDSGGIMKGYMTAEDIIDNIEDEVTEDIHRAAGIIEGTKSYMQSTVWDIFKSRIGWLVILLFVASAIQMITESFQELWGITEGADTSNTNINIAAWAIPAFTSALAVVSLLNDTAGNTGTQTVSTVLRALSTNDIEDGEYRKVFWKETKVATSVGATLFVANFVRMIIIDLISFKGGQPRLLNDPVFYVVLALVTSGSLFLVVMVSKLLAVILPYIAVRTKIDPAAFAGPMVTTTADIFAVAIHFTLITLVFAPGVFGLA